MNLLRLLREQVACSLEKITSNAQEHARAVRPVQDAKFGDYQANCAMALKKEVGGNPRDIANRIVEGLPNQTWFSKVEVAGPGFVNLSLADDFLIRAIDEIFTDPKLGIEPPRTPSTIVIDYSSPNVAKPMHVGHLRSTVLGDALARIYRAIGWRVITDNHLGDWGTQFGMLIYGWRNLRDEVAAQADPLAELTRLYKEVNRLSETDPSVATAARNETAKLHEGDPENLALWRQFMPWCLADLQQIYDRLGIRFDYQYGESFYQPMLADTVRELQSRNLAVESDGAICVFFLDPSGKVDEEGKPIALLPPQIIRKADGAFTYSTSDLACIRYRVETFSPDIIAYVVDDRQSDHFRQLFQTARNWGFTNVQLQHVPFGKIMGKDGRPFKTREGTTVGLSNLLDEAVERVRQIVDENSKDLTPAERKEIADVVGPAAVKYADLMQNRSSDYVFDWDKMISLNGNTSVYMQYAYARTRGILRRSESVERASNARPTFVIQHSSERTLMLNLLRYPETLEQSAVDFKPNVVTAYLYELANALSGFYRDCPVLKAETDALRQSRIALCDLTGRVIRSGLEVLGIGVLDRM